MRCAVRGARCGARGAVRTVRCGAEQGGATAGNDAFFHRSAGGVQGVLDASFLFLHFRLGCGAYVAELRRTQAGPFSLAQTVTLEELEAVHAEGGNEAVDRFLMPSDSGLLDWPLLHFSEHSAFYWLNGQPVRAPDAPKFGMVRVQDHNGRFIGIGEVSEDGRIAPRRLIRSE